ncbi:hemagglutinin repeat-containing protein [Lonepinella sp. MS14435]|uniref:two-partner secretion domain-containing protein n=1 Tax=Lonepinella sp. MS14435 TaxID=3003618 RepID=UPI0036DA9BE6
MNKHCYRIIFSKTLNCLVVVSELAKTAGKAVAGFANKLLSIWWQRTPDFSLNIVAFTCFIGLGLIYVPQTMAQPAEIHADRSAPSSQQPTVLRTENNTPQVNIQTPSAGGVSRNVYSQFDVSEKGAILNNARKSTSSQLAGWVQANPNLIQGEAKIILNEVNAKDPSQLKGYVEVAGKKADVIIANPSGLHCDGCGVINAGRTTLTTGQVELENGNVKGFNVRGGKVEVAGKGMDTSRADYTDIIAGHAKIDAGIWAKELKVTAGKNKVDRSNSKVVYVGNNKGTDTSSTENSDNQKIAYAVDVTELGGMYANQIYLVATEQGVGVNNAGKIGASAGNVQIDSQGKITNNGYLGAQQDITVSSQNDIANKGTIYTQQGDVKLNGKNVVQQGEMIAKGAAQQKGHVKITAKQAIQQNGGTLAENHIEYQAKNIAITNNATVVAGLKFTENTLDKSDTGGNTHLHAEESAVINGQVLSSNRTEIKAANINLAHSRLHSNHLLATASHGGIIASNSNIYTAQSAVFNTPTVLNTSNAQLNANHIGINANQVDNTQGTWINRDGQDLNLNFKLGLTNAHGQIVTNGRLLFNGKQIDNQAGLMSANTYQITTPIFDNTHGKLIQQGVNPFTLSVNGELINDSGVIGYSLQNQNTTNNPAENATHVQNVSTNVGVNTSTSDQPSHSMPNGVDTVSQTTNIASTLEVTEKLNNEAGTILSGSQTTLQGEGKLSNDSGTLNLAEFSWKSDKSVNNHLGLMSSINTLTLYTPELNNTQGQIQAQHDLLVDATTLNNSENGLLYSNTDLNLNAKELDNRQGTVQALGNVTLNQLAMVNNSAEANKSGSLIQAGKQLKIEALKIDNQNTKSTEAIPVQGLLGQTVALSSDTLNNQQGGIYVSQALSASVKNLVNNQKGEILSGGTLNTVGSALAIQNREGVIASIGKLMIDANRISDMGKIQTKNDADIALKQDLTFHGGIEVEGNLKLKTDNLTNDATLLVGKGLHIQTGRLINNENATLGSNTTLLDANSLTNYGLIDGTQTRLNTHTLDNIGTGRIYGDQLSIQAGKLNNIEQNGKSATIAARHRLDLGVGTLTNSNDSSLISLGELHIGGTLDSQGYATGKATAIYNQNGLIEARDHIYINSGLVSNTHNYFHTAFKLVSQQDVTEYQGSGDPTIYQEGTDGLYVFNNESDHLRVPTGAYYDSWCKYRYLKSVQRTEVLPAEYEPGRIYSGKDITVRGDRVENINSRMIAGGKLDIPANILNNQAETGVEIITKAGCAAGSRNEVCRNLSAELRGYSDDAPRRKNSAYGLHSYWRHHEKGRDSTGHRRQDYTPAQEIKEGIPLEVAAYKEYSLPSFSNTAISAINVPPSVDVQVKSAVQNGVNHQNNGSVVKDNAVIRTQEQSISLPHSSLFIINPQSTAGYLVETDPAFTQYRNWLSSNYMMKALNLNSDVMHKRIGDGFYEQRLVQEQIAELTGRVYLSDYSSQEEQYKALMTNGITAATQFQLTPGVALTSEQISRLTSDMVWLVNKTITLADGSTTTVLYPQVYAVVQKGDINGYGALLSGDSTTLESSHINNSGTIAGKNLLAISADNITNRFGKMTGGNTLVSAEQYLINTGGTIEASQILNVNAGRDIVLNTTTHTAQTANSETVRLGTQGGFYLTGKDGRQMWINAGRDINLTAGDIANNAQNALTAIQAGRDILLNTAQQSDRYENIHDAENYLKTANRQNIGSTITSQSQKNTLLQAGRNIEAKAATVTAKGDVQLKAGQHINISTGEEYHLVDSAFKDTSRGLFSKSSTKTRDVSEQTLARGSQIDGGNVSVVVQQGNVNVVGSDVVAENALSVLAKNINITEAVNQIYSENFKQVKKSGLLSSGGIGFTIGSRKETTANDQTQFSARQSQVGSLKGNTTLLADESYHQSGSVVTSKDGDVLIVAKNANITAARSHYDSHYKYTMEKGGFTIAFNAPALTALQGVMSTINASKNLGESKNNRINALAVANVGFDVARSAEQLKGLSNALQADPKQALTQDVSVSITYGKQKNTETQYTQGNKVEKSQVNAGGEVNIVTTGTEKNDDLTIVGSDISGNQGTHLKSNGNINILAADENHLERSQNKSSGWNAGIAVSYGQSGFSFGITAGGNLAKGYGNGDSKAWVNSYIGNQHSRTTIDSQKDTNIKSSQIVGKQITVNAENLNIESLQDTATYKGKQESISGQVTVGYGVSASASYSKSKINSDYASVNQQAGIFAGDDGFKVNVANHTNLTGALITSTESAEENSRNSFTTGTLSYSDIENHADYKGSSFGLSGSVTRNGGWTGKDKNGVTKAIGFGLDSDSQNSVTKSGIGTANIQIKNSQEQEKLTGKSVDEMILGIKTDVTTNNAEQHSGKLEQNFDAKKVQDELNLQQKVTQEFDSNRQYMKEKLLSQADELFAEARQERKKNGGEDNDKSRELEEKAHKISQTTSYLDTALGAFWGLTLSVDAAIGQVVAQHADYAQNAATHTTAGTVYKLDCSGAAAQHYCRGMDDDTRKVEWEGKAREIYDMNEIKNDNGKNVVVSNPGIYNTKYEAFRNAVKQNPKAANGGNLYVVLNNPSYGVVPLLSEGVFYAGYDKLNEIIGAKLPLTNAEKTNVVLNEHGAINNVKLEKSNHSRGTLTESVSLQYTNDHFKDEIGKPIAIPLEKVRFVGGAANAERYYGVLENNNYTNKNGVFTTFGQATHELDFVGVPIGENSATGGACKGLCYSHSGYYGQVPNEFLQNQYGNDLLDKNGNGIKNLEYGKYTKLWGEPRKDQNGTSINDSAPKILVRDQDGNFHLINSTSGNGIFEYGGKKYYENVY